jgi:peroxiredoxin
MPGTKGHPREASRARSFVWLFSATLFLFAACARKPLPVVGEPVPEIALRDLAGQEVRLSDFKGQVVVINFWATWCPPCVDEMPALEKLHRSLGPKGLKVLAVSVDYRREDIEAFREQHRLSFTMLHDQGLKAARSYGTFKYPETYIVDRQGRLVSKEIGPAEWVSPVYLHRFVELLKTSPVG